MDRAADMSAALAFVINRIEEQAMRSGQPLDEEQRFLLNNLPDQSDVPEFSTGDPEFPMHFRLRDVTYERLCAFAKAAYRSDREMNPGSFEWEFAFNVSKLTVTCVLAFGVGWCETVQDLVGQMAFGRCFAASRHSYCCLDAPRYRPREGFVAMGNCRSGYIGLLLFMHFVSRRLEERQLEQNIENCRGASRSVGTLK